MVKKSKQILKEKINSTNQIQCFWTLPKKLKKKVFTTWAISTSKWTLPSLSWKKKWMRRRRMLIWIIKMRIWRIPTQFPSTPYLAESSGFMMVQCLRNLIKQAWKVLNKRASILIASEAINHNQVWSHTLSFKEKLNSEIHMDTYQLKNTPTSLTMPISLLYSLPCASSGPLVCTNIKRKLLQFIGWWQLFYTPAGLNPYSTLSTIRAWTVIQKTTLVLQSLRSLQRSLGMYSPESSSYWLLLATVSQPSTWELTKSILESWASFMLLVWY